VRAGCGPRLYNRPMSKGWESKSVESQMAAAQEWREPGPRSDLTEEQKKKKRELDGLLLARTNLLNQREASTNERYRQTLQSALDELDRRIEGLR